MQEPNEIATIEGRRLAELKKQAAMFGPNTEPSVLIEISDLENKKRRRRRSTGKNSILDYDLLMNVVAAALVRLTTLENRNNVDDKSRLNRQFIHDIWMIAITIIVLMNLLLVLNR